MKMNKNELNKLYGNTLFPLIEEILDEFIAKNYSVEMIMDALSTINETVRIGIYLLALAKNEGVMALKIEKANKKLNEIRKEKFLEAFKKNDTARFLALLGKGDKISLMSDLGVNEDAAGRASFTLEQRIYYEILSEAIKSDQEVDKRNGLEQFLKHKRSKKDS